MVRHGPLLQRPQGCAVGWVQILCDCGWSGEPTASQHKAIEDYGDHRAQEGDTKGDWDA